MDFYRDCAFLTLLLQCPPPAPDGGLPDGGLEDGGQVDGGVDGGTGDGGSPDYLVITHTDPPNGHNFLDFNELKVVIGFDRPLDPATIVQTPMFYRLLVYHEAMNPIEDQFDDFQLKDGNQKIEFTLHGANVWNNRFELTILQTLRGQDGTYLEHEYKHSFFRPQYYYFNDADFDPTPVPPQFFTYQQNVSVFQKGVPTSGPGNAFDKNKCWATILDGNYPLQNTEILDGGVTVGEVPEARMVSPVIDLTNARAPVYLTFHHWYELAEDSLVGNGDLIINVQIKKEGQDWELIRPLTGVLDAYGKPIGYMKYLGVTLADYWMYNSDGQWRQEIFGLDSFIGHKIQFSFHMQQHYNMGVKFPAKPGWYIDYIWIKQMQWPVP